MLDEQYQPIEQIPEYADEMEYGTCTTSCREWIRRFARDPPLMFPTG